MPEYGNVLRSFDVSANATTSDQSSSLKETSPEPSHEPLTLPPSPLPSSKVEIAAPSLDVLTPTVKDDYIVVHTGPKSTLAHLTKMGVIAYSWITPGWKFKMKTFAVTGRPESDEHTATYEFNSNDSEGSDFLSGILYGLSLGFAKYVHRHYRVVVVFRNIRASKVLEVIDLMTFAEVLYRMDGRCSSCMFFLIF